MGIILHGGKSAIPTNWLSEKGTEMSEASFKATWHNGENGETVHKHALLKDSFMVYDTWWCTEGQAHFVKWYAL